jgi:glycosyltransferase involved in cell wall biosynthesis
MRCGAVFLIICGGVSVPCPLETSFMKILFLSRWFPYPLNNGSKLRVAGLLRGLAKQHEITLVSFTDQPKVDLEASGILSVCREVYLIPWREFNSQSKQAWLGFLGIRPRFLSDTYSSEMDTLIRTLLAKSKYDLVIASQLSMASYYPCFEGTPAVFEEIELGQFYNKVAQAEGFLKRLRFSLTWFKLRIYFSRLLDAFDKYTVVSEQEQRLFVENFPKHAKQVRTVPNCIEYNDYQGLQVEPLPNRIIFSGSFRYQANYEAMQWFVREVYSKILAQLPETSLIITGDHADLPLPPAPNIILAGNVDDIKSSIASACVSIAPLLSGGGTRLKILEAMALGTPVVSTSKGAEGLTSTSGEQLLVADSPEGFAEQVINVLKNKELRKHLSINGNRFVKENYNWETVMPRFLSLVESARV